MLFTDKVRRLEALLTKCKESIKANKQKTSALTEVKDSLSKQLSEREADLIALTDTFNRTNAELTQLKTKEQEEELQMAQAKMHMHQASVQILYTTISRVQTYFFRHFCLDGSKQSCQKKLSFRGK